SLGGKYRDGNELKVGGNQFRNTVLGQLPVPLPANYVIGFDIQKSDFEYKSWAYLHGKWQGGGWWYYYVNAFFVKEPIGLILLVIISTGISLKCLKQAWRQDVILLLPAICVFVLVSSQTGMNEHYRYIIPVFPFVFIWTSKVASYFPRIATVAVGLLILSSLAVYPHSLSYFNEFIGGPKNGGKYLLGGTIDWGQDILLLKKWQDENPNASPFFLKYSSYFDPKYAGVVYNKQEPNVTTPGWHAISVNYLHGRDEQYRDFLQLKPVELIGYTIYIYYIPETEK
ncbi:MAG: hypothetical protein ACRC2T_18490, partial [Thermoguttaceae bacterium]